MLGSSILGIYLLANCLTAQEKAADPPPWPILKAAADRKPLPGTEPLTLEGDISRQLHDGADRFLDRQIAESVAKRDQHWKRDFSSPEAYEKSIAPNRERFAGLLGLDRDPRHDPKENRLLYTAVYPGPWVEGDNFTIHEVTWRAFGQVNGIGLLFEPKGAAVADVVAIPDAGQTPEKVSRLHGAKLTSDFALKLAQNGCRVLVPLLINRQETPYAMTNREWLHRPAFELGRHLVGYEVQKVLAGVDCLLNSQGKNKRPLGVIGWGEGGMIALYASAVDPRIEATCVSGYFGSRQDLWKEPAEHNVFGLLREFGDAEIASLVAPRPLVIENAPGPQFVFRAGPDGEPERLDERPGKKGKPGAFHSPSSEEAEAEVKRLRALIAGLDPLPVLEKSEADKALSDATLAAFAGHLGIDSPDLSKKVRSDQFLKIIVNHGGIDLWDRNDRHAAQMAEIDRHNQWALIQSRQDRAELFDAMVKTDSLEAFNESIEGYRDLFRTEVVGEFEVERLPLNPRTRKYQEGPKTISYEVVLDVFDDVIAYGILTLPKDLDISSGEKRPVVVCQHGLEGTPQDVVGEPKYKAYKAFATRLAERGFITFAPQNLYKYHDIFRIQQFKAQSLGCTLFSIMVPSHRQITGWLAAQPFVDSERIGFYGLSYGGKSAMRIPPLVDNYCLSICSADFNEWVWKNAATDPKSLRYSYANKGEYEIFEWNLGGTFNYAEMAALICPRPFMVERGHFDGVAPDETVAYEFAKVRHLYQAKLGIGDRAEIEWFVGPHSINGEGTFEFLHKHLDWPDPKN